VPYIALPEPLIISTFSIMLAGIEAKSAPPPVPISFILLPSTRTRVCPAEAPLIEIEAAWPKGP
jgi:hypothetical protein